MRPRLLLAICITSTLFAVCNAKGPTVATEKVFVLYQKHRWLGKVIVYCNADHIRVATLESGAALVSNAPDWRVQIYDPQRKLVYEVTKEQFFDSGYTGPFQDSGLIKTKLTQISRGQMANIPSNCYTYSRATKSTYWTLRSNLTGTVCQVLQALYECPSAPGIPLAIETQNTKRRSGSDNMIVFAEGGGSELTTARCETGTIDVSKFSYVSGYKRARFATDVLVNKKIKNDLETGISEFGLGLEKTK
ncbi:hypothetical protein BH10CYA1_BH10CYA1_56890 [soil metagenome]